MFEHRAILGRFAPAPFAAVVVATVVILTLGCTPYVNVPAQNDAVALHRPNYDTVTHVIAAAVSAVVADRPPAGPYIVALPQGVAPGQYDVVLASLGPNAIAATKAQDNSLPVIDARRVRVRGWKAEVDVIRPIDATQPQGMKQLVTVELARDMVEGWSVTHLRPWQLDAEEALRVTAEAEKLHGQQ